MLIVEVFVRRVETEEDVIGFESAEITTEVEIGVSVAECGTCAEVVIKKEVIDAESEAKGSGVETGEGIFVCSMVKAAEATSPDTGFARRGVVGAQIVIMAEDGVIKLRSSCYIRKGKVGVICWGELTESCEDINI